ncbi:hypothetical protein IFT80_20000 [Pseudomonas sp. CFBP 8771]|uniref:hypothetical protein n=1 Tax=Pseudomonas sp. CFBP 8771 TaxID=2775285 RepID=UPI00177D3D17|nr:hypothetical protein [Pseudomonas sp. CFBP 8771]MBD8604927.1 hypothetical protein [Pseudomonas sp. CFBP 8771]
MSQESFNRLVALYRAITFVPGTREGSLTIADTNQLNELQNLLTEPRQYGISLLDERLPASLNVGETIRLHADDPRIGVGLLAERFEDVLAFPSSRIKEPRFYLLPLAWACTDNTPPEQIQRYRHVLCFIKLLEESAAYLDKENQDLVYIDDGKFTVPLQYSVQDLAEVDIASLEALIARCNQDTHREQKLTIMAKAVQKLCDANSAQERFSALLKRLPELLKQFDEGYRLFVADFSYEKVLDQMETAKLEELAKIHKTFADVQNQILGIPVATIIVATQLKETSTVDAIFWVNSAILVGVWVFVVLTWLVMRNQLHTLDALDDEIKRKKEKIEKDYAPVKDVVSGIFPKLEARLETQRWAFRAVYGVVTLGFVMAHVMYLVLTHPVGIYLGRAWRFLSSFC